LLGRRLLSESGHELGTVDDVTFDPVSGALEALHGGGHQMAADAVLGAGSYAVVVAASPTTV
jgi:sporulation protein YlmC with PRC-barrel domain